MRTCTEVNDTTAERYFQGMTYAAGTDFKIDVFHHKLFDYWSDDLTQIFDA